MESTSLASHPTRRFSKRTVIVAAIVVVVILASSILAQAVILPFFQHPLRRDAVSGAMYVVPWVQLSPTSFTSEPGWNLNYVMPGSLRINTTFHVPLTNRIVNGTIYLGHDSHTLYVGGMLHGVWYNPTSGVYNVPGQPPYYDVAAESFYLFLDADNDGVLTQPEAGFGASFQIACGTGVVTNAPDCGTTPNSWKRPYGASAGSMMWMDSAPYYIPDFKHPYWSYGFLQNGQTQQQGSFAATNMTSEYQSTTGDLQFVVGEQLSYSGAQLIDALQMRPGERWVMGFMFQFGYENATSYLPGTTGPNSIQDWGYYDGWPRNVFPYSSNDTSSWPRLVINLISHQ